MRFLIDDEDDAAQISSYPKALQPTFLPDRFGTLELISGNLATLFAQSKRLPSLLGTTADVPRLAAAMFTVSYRLAVGAALLAAGCGTAAVPLPRRSLPLVLLVLILTLLGVTLPLRSGVTRRP